MQTTIGLSPKAVLAFLLPLIAAFGGTVSTWITSGTFNAAEIKTAVAGLIASGLALLGAYLAPPGEVANVANPASIPPDEGDPGRPEPRER